jgi:hypothetical protein
LIDIKVVLKEWASIGKMGNERRDKQEERELEAAFKLEIRMPGRQVQRPEQLPGKINARCCMMRIRILPPESA